MGIVRYVVECPGCEQGFVLRLGVGHDPVQPFFYVCPHCSAATKGALHWDGGLQTELKLEAGRQLGGEAGCTKAVSINPEIPSQPDALEMNQVGGSPFLHFFGLLGPDRFMAYQSVIEPLRHQLKSDWPALRRLTTYHQNRDWKHFDKQLTQLLPDDAPRPSEEWHRDDLLHRIYEIFLLGLCALEDTPYFPVMKSEWCAMWDRSNPNQDVGIRFAKTEASTPAFLNAHRDILSNIARYVENLSALLPGLLCNIVPSDSQHHIADLRMFRDDYEVLRDLYINSFEACHKSLRWIIGGHNALINGDWNKFVPPATAPHLASKTPKDLAKFTKLVSADKRQWLATLPEWNTHWDALFDRQLRNDIGHASARHDLATGTIQRDGNSPLLYTRFVQQVQRVIHGLIACADALKYIRIYSFA